MIITAPGDEPPRLADHQLQTILGRRPASTIRKHRSQSDPAWHYMDLFFIAPTAPMSPATAVIKAASPPRKAHGERPVDTCCARSSTESAFQIDRKVIAAPRLPWALAIAHDE
jgi:hypothetical protein